MAAIDLTFGTQLSIDYGTKRGTEKELLTEALTKLRNLSVLMNWECFAILMSFPKPVL